MMAIFPSVFFQRLNNTLATRQIKPKAAGAFELYWTYFGYADDDPKIRLMRLRQVNLIGPGGLVSMEDGEAGRLVQLGIGREQDAHSVIEMAASGRSSIRTRSTPRCRYVASGATTAISWASSPPAAPIWPPAEAVHAAP